MICPKCGMQNAEGSKFCIKCGGNLYEPQINQTVNRLNEDNNLQEQQMNYSQSPTAQTNYYTQQQSQTTQQINNNKDTKMSVSECFFITIAVILKPFTTFKQELNKFNEFKNSAILSLMVSIIATLISLAKTMLSTVKVTSYWTGETKWVWENLKNIKYIKVIGTNFLIYLGIIAAIAGVYYVGSLIVKKQTNFSRLLGISAAAIVPIICSMIISPLLAMIYSPLEIAVTVIGSLYTMIIIYEIINNEIKIEGNAKIYFNLICLSIIFIGGGFIAYKLVLGSLTSGLGALGSLFN